MPGEQLLGGCTFPFLDADLAMLRPVANSFGTKGGQKGLESP